MIKPAGIAILIAIVPIQIIGVLYLCREYRRHVRFFRDAIVVDGLVVGTREFSGADGPEYFARVFYTVAGVEYMLKDGITTQWRRYKRGQRVKVYYPAESPGSGRIAQPLLPGIYSGGAFLIAVTAVMAFAALLVGLKELQWLQ